ncbi:DUF2818 family protein [Bordetella avium]|uniref:Membrane protein n=1 Tax=Bordetella avium (strain 197N) TaxID=360910 RepID=Q2KUY4_BORA1|nr:DUF2818 family protein [Bordetella avium]AZY48557.1 DUF2818 domain-containing protein [Bordetella avium]AZY51937.1 DUF2818 domain-containing protein [Bordetella avium]RIQ13864.1 DUF2818 family protein [Bordetella avium]RIQ17062.1 DUF2818 family protein [Bordetella avium]RIQ36212.1 DUF2818 family protein [Bordetella avium]
MSQSLAVWLLIALAVVSANLPFLTDRVFAVFALKGGKTVAIRFLELLVYYLIVGLAGRAFESALGNPFAQTWEFYAITLSLYLVLAYPGFVYRYLFLRKRSRPA